jgi:hypothetical protein
MRFVFLFCSLLMCFTVVVAQEKRDTLTPSSGKDSMVLVNGKLIQLSEVVVRSNLNIPRFVQLVQEDTTFHKAFKNLHILGFTSLNDIRMMDKKGNLKGFLQSRTRQSVANGCRSMEVLEEKATGDIYDRNHNLNYYTAQMYAGLVFTTGTVCGENNIVKGSEMSTKGKSGFAKHKEQLKMLFFNPGHRIPGLPFIANKVALFDDNVSALYDFKVSMEEYRGENCYVFRIKSRDDLTASERNDVVIDEMTTWFNHTTMDIMARTYTLSYNAGVYDFNVQMEVQLTRFGNYLVPNLIRYNGNWDVVLKKRERGLFTATLFDFK